MSALEHQSSRKLARFLVTRRLGTTLGDRDGYPSSNNLQEIIRQRSVKKVKPQLSNLEEEGDGRVRIMD